MKRFRIRSGESSPVLPRPSARRAGLETGILTAFAAALGGLRVAYVFSRPYDSDEPQHLHVAWAWTRGLLPYRDVFDNHAPLFHMLSAPFVAWIGEDPRILVFMRLLMLPIFALALWGCFLLGRRLFGRRAGAWAALVCGLSPTFFFKSLEYRPDLLWAALWVLAIVVLAGGSRLSARRGFCGGLLLGLCLAISIKSVMLLGALAFASLSMLLLVPARDPGARRRIAPFVASVLGGLLLPPAAIVLFFATRREGLAAMYDGTIRHNLLPGVGQWGDSIRAYLLVPFLVLLFLAARLIVKRISIEPARVGFVLLLAGAQYILLSTVWPVHTRQDLLPFYPLFCVLLAGLLLARRDAAAGSIRRRTWSAPRAALVPGILACVELAILPALAPLGASGVAPQEEGLAEILALTDPGDSVMDAKGQAVFRERPFHYALETMTLERMERGLIKDTIPERCIATRTAVAQADLGGFPPRARRFFEDNYVVVGAWRVAGRVIDPAAGEEDVPFDIVIPGRYALLAERGGAVGRLDGLAYDAPLDLAPGRHVLRPASGSGPVAVMWAQAAERGFSPWAAAGRTSAPSPGADR